MKQIIYNAVRAINSKRNKYENVLEEALQDWQKDGSMPENAPKCIQRYIIEDNKDKEKFYKAFQAVLKEQIVENNLTNVDRLIQIFTQANNTEINQKIVQITTEVIQDDLGSKKSKLKSDDELKKKLSEIIQNNFAEFYKVKNQVEDKNTDTFSKEKKKDKDSSVSKNKDKVDSKNIPLTATDAYDNLLKLLSRQISDKNSTSSIHSTNNSNEKKVEDQANDNQSYTSPNNHKKEIKEQSTTDQINNSFDEKKLEDQNDNFQSTQNILEPREKPAEIEIAGSQSLPNKGGHLDSID